MFQLPPIMLVLPMATSNHHELPPTSAWFDNLPGPKQDSRWDGIFLVPLDPIYGLSLDIMLTWYWRTFIHPEGELHHEWQGSR